MVPSPCAPADGAAAGQVADVDEEALVRPTARSPTTLDDHGARSPGANVSVPDVRQVVVVADGRGAIRRREVDGDRAARDARSVTVNLASVLPELPSRTDTSPMVALGPPSGTIVEFALRADVNSIGAADALSEPPRTNANAATPDRRA